MVRKYLALLISTSLPLIVVGGVLGWFSSATRVAQAAPGGGGIVISQAYGGGGGSSGQYLYDFVELFNAGSTPADIGGWTLQYGSYNGNFGSNAYTILTFTTPTVINPGQYYLLQSGTAGSGGLPFPVTADGVFSASMGAGGGKLALVNIGSPLGCGATATPCPLPDSRIVDLVAYGNSNNAEGGTAVTGANSSTKAALRNWGGCQDTDNNFNDFTVVVSPTITPRNSDSPANVCGLQISKSAPATVATGSAYTYSLAVFNTAVTATNMVLTDALPAGVSLVPGSISDGGELLPGNIVSWSVASLGHVTTTTRTFMVTAPLISGLVTNQDYQVYAENLPTPVVGAPVNTLVGLPDLAVTKTGPETAVDAGDTLTFTLTYGNAGEISALGTLVDQLPPGLAYVSDSLGTGVQAGNTITWNVGTVAAGAQSSVVVTASALYAGEQLNRATISGIPADTNLDNNVSTYAVTVNGADPTVSKLVTPAAALGGEVFTYTIVANNLGNAGAVVTITDSLPTGFTVSDIAADTSGLTPVLNVDSTRAWATTLAPNSPLTFTLALTVPGSIATGTSVTNTVQVATEAAGNDPANDTATASSVVFQVVPIDVARAGTLGQTYFVEGVVTAEPGVFKTAAGQSRYLYIQDATGGLLVYYGGNLNPVARDHRVRAQGVLATYNTETQLQVPSPAAVVDLGPGVAVSPLLTTTGALNESLEGELVQVTGAVVFSFPASYRVRVNDGSGLAEISRYSNQNLATDPYFVDFSQLVVGDVVSVTGLLRSTQASIGGYYQIIPRGGAEFVEYPRVLSVTPAADATDVPAANPVTASFNLTMTNVSGSTFSLQGPAGAVAGTVTYNPTTKVATLTPDVQLAYGTRYTATLSAALAAQNGLTLFPASDYTWSFTTYQPMSALALSKAVATPRAQMKLGDVVTFTVILTNSGDGAATGVVVTDVLPAEVTFGGFVGSTPAGTVQAGQTLTWTGTAEAFAAPVGQWVFTATVGSDWSFAGRTVSNTAYFTSDNGGHSSDIASFRIEDRYFYFLPLVRR